MNLRDLQNVPAGALGYSGCFDFVSQCPTMDPTGGSGVYAPGSLCAWFWIEQGVETAWGAGTRTARGPIGYTVTEFSEWADPEWGGSAG